MSVFLMIKCMFLHSTMPPCLVNSFQAFTWFQMFPETWCYLNQMWMEEQHPKQVYEIVTRGRCLLRSLWLSCVAVMGEDQPITISLQLKSSSTTYFSFQVVIICLVLCLVFFSPSSSSLFPFSFFAFKRWKTRNVLFKTQHFFQMLNIYVPNEQPSSVSFF